MAQYARPYQDAVNGWLSGGWAEVDESSPSDADYAYGSTNATETLTLDLTSVTDPNDNTGHVVRYRITQGNNSDPPTVPADTTTVATITCRLLQGGTQIAAHSTQNCTGAWVTVTWNIDSADAANITNYGALQLEFVQVGTGGGPAGRRRGVLGWTELEVPDVATISTKKMFLLGVG